MVSVTSVDIVLFICFVCFCIYLYLTSNFDYWNKRNVVVYKKPYPIVGTVGSLFLVKISINDFVNLVYNKYPDQDVVGGYEGTRPTLMVRSPDMIKHILIKDFNNFRERGFISPDPKREPLAQQLFLAKGDLWRALRQKLTPTFTSGKLKNGFPLLLENGEEFQNYLRGVLHENGEELEVKELMEKFTTDVIGSYAFGIKMNSLKDKNAQFREMRKKIFEISFIKAVSVVIFRFSPSLFYLLGLRFDSIEVQNFFINLFKSVAESRNNKPSTRNDFVDLLLELKTKGFVKNDKSFQGESNDVKALSLSITDELLTAQAFIFFAAGFETSSATMSFVLYELAMNLPVQQKLLKEIDDVLSKHNGQLTYEAVKEMDYLRMVINETLRKYPPLGILGRQCEEPYTIPNTNINIDKQVMIQIPVYAIHNDPKYYPEPQKFIPERFTPEEEAKRHPCLFLPFGDGPRNCIGDRFARVQMTVGLVSILQHYTVQAGNKTVPKINFSARSFITANDKGIYLKLNRRNLTIPTTDL